MSYDAWKTRSPDDGYWDDAQCYHEHYESDILTGRASCCYCDHTWYLSEEEIAAERASIERYEKYQRQQNRLWRRLVHSARRARLGRWWGQWRFERQLRRDFSDDVPF